MLRTPALAACVALSAALHLAGLGFVASDGRARAAGGVHPAAMTVRIAAAPGSAPADRPAAPVAPALEAIDRPLPALPQDPPAATPEQAESGADAPMEYVPRWLLSTVPAAVGNPVVDFPPGATGASRLSARVELFIDERGEVNRVEIADPLPPAFAEAVQAGFLRAHFSPGEIDGVAVRSRIRIQVNFESGPLEG